MFSFIHLVQFIWCNTISRQPFHLFPEMHAIKCVLNFDERNEMSKRKPPFLTSRENLVFGSFLEVRIRVIKRILVLHTLKELRAALLQHEHWKLLVYQQEARVPTQDFPVRLQPDHPQH